ncbi:MAG: MBL fold metallo-hydrolase [Oscillochloris sp.]|nr:MBL fold metallo-hydrolase [Oscillochloris sp.]
MPEQLTAGLWVFPSHAMAYNAGVFLHNGQALLIDPGTHPDESAQVGAFVAARGAHIVACVLTHSHWDHILGPERLPPMPLVAQARYPTCTAHDGADILRHVARWEAKHGYRRARTFAIPQPERLIGALGRIAVGGAELQLLHIPGHASDQLAIYAPDEGWLWAADTLSDREIPFVSESLAHYEQSLARLTALPARLLVPGHGSPARSTAEIAARSANDTAYLTGLRTTISATLAAGGDIEAARSACAAIPLIYAAENRRPHQLNVESVFIELGGSADPERVGWSQKGLIDE